MANRNSTAYEDDVVDRDSETGAGPTTGTWTVWRQDDGGNKYVISSGHRREDAERIVRELEARGHKQTYWTTEAPGKLGAS